MLELGLGGKVAIVTGGSEGLGRATAERFAREGARVAICARRKDVLEQAAERIRKVSGAEVLAQPADVTVAGDVEAFVNAVVARFGGVDILVNNAGTSSAAPFLDVDDATWQRDIDVKLMAAIRFCRLVIPLMRQRGGGRIINVTTVGGKTPAPRSLPTSVTRAAGINLTKSLASELAAERILVNTVCLGLVKSAQWERRAKGDLEAYYREAAKRVPVGRVGEAEEFADLVAFLVSERAGYITGTAINFDGGMASVFNSEGARLASEGASTAPSEASPRIRLRRRSRRSNEREGTRSRADRRPQVPCPMSARKTRVCELGPPIMV